MAVRKPVYTVTQINTYIRNMFTQDYLLRNIAVCAEVRNCKYHSSGHIYFTLKDEEGSLACVMFAGSRKGLTFPMKDGDQVVVQGRISVYERDGKYQLYAERITRQGAGALYERYLELKQELEEMGLFSPIYKKPIPLLVQRLGVVTAPTGAAIQDIRNITLRRNPYVQIILYPALVQGEGAKESIVRGIRLLDQADCDVIIVGRGGGSIEDLWAFNEEVVANAIFDCRTPVISAVGHETDHTISDEVADLRAPTPSAAAELAVLDIREFMETLRVYEQRLYQAERTHIVSCRQQLERYEKLLLYMNPRNQLEDRQQQLVTLEDRLQQLMQGKLEQAKEQTDRYREQLLRVKENGVREARFSLQMYLEKMKGLSPLSKLNQGYAHVENKAGQTINSITQVQKGTQVDIYVSDGLIHAETLTTGKVDYDGK